MTGDEAAPLSLSEPVLVLSPHLDDAWLSAANLLLARRCEVWTVFAGAPTPVQSTQWDHRCGFADSAETMQTRAAEDVAAFEGTTHTVRRLPYLDGAYTDPDRRRSDLGQFGDDLRRWLSAHPVATIVLPVCAGARVRPGIWEPAAARIRTRVRRDGHEPPDTGDEAATATIPASTDARRSGPIGMAKHLAQRTMHADYQRRRRAAQRNGMAVNPDHIAVRDTALEVCRASTDVTIAFYEDLPYLWSARGDDQAARIVSGRNLVLDRRSVEVDRAAKFDHLRCYDSQLVVLDPIHHRLSSADTLPAEEIVWLARARDEQPTQGPRTGRPPVVSVVIPTLNGAATIEQQLDALADQETDLTYEVVVADNGSTDATAAIVDSLASTYPTSLRRVPAVQRKGICHARNAGVIASRGAYILMCDCDDVVDRNWVEQAWVALQDADLVGGARRMLRDSTAGSDAAEVDDRLFGRPGRWAVHGCNFAVRRAVYFDVGGFDESLPPYGCDDVEFSFRVTEHGYALAAAPRMIVNFRVTSGAVSGFRKTFLSAKAEVEVWKRRPADYANLLGRRRALIQLLRVPRDSLRGGLRGEPADLRTTMRTAVTRWGHLAAQLPAAARAQPSPILLSPADDPERSAQPD